jgi:predicted glycoside hydrolase/deacetylase ChbG (UPF0249 family)
MTRLIINADDFGHNIYFNKMILELIQEGALTSVSVLIDYITSEQKEQFKKLVFLSKEKSISIGLHIDFKTTDFETEINRQFNKFVDIFGLDPTHIDIHKDTYLKDGYKSIQKFCQNKMIPYKNLSFYGDDVMIENINQSLTTKNSTFSATQQSFKKIEEWLGSLKDDIYVINFHPGYYHLDDKLILNKEREADAENARKVVTVLKKYNIQLANFNDLGTS